MFRFMLLATLLLGTAFTGAAPAQPVAGPCGELEGPCGGLAEQDEPIAPGSGLDGPLDARELARAMFEASRADPKQIARQKLEAAQRGYESEVSMEGLICRRPPGKHGFDFLLEWSQRWLAAELDLRESPAEQAAAYKRHWLHTWEAERTAQVLFYYGRIDIGEVNPPRYQRLTAEMDWARARAGQEKPRPQAEKLPAPWPPEVSFDEGRSSPMERAKAQFEASPADLGELARQRLAAARVVHRARLEAYLADKAATYNLPELAVLVTEAELAVPGGKVDEAAVRERAWEMAWMAHEITRGHFAAGRMKAADRIPPHVNLAASRYALLQAEIALVRAGQAKRPDRVGSLLNEPNLAKAFDAKAMARGRAEVGRADLGDLLRQQRETAHTGYRVCWNSFLAYVAPLDLLLEWSPRLLESELALDDRPAARETAFARYWKLAWQIEAVEQGRFEEGRASTAELMAARYARLGAELLWAQARQARKSGN